MGKFWVLAGLVAIPSVVSAPWQNLNPLQAGQRIQVVEISNKESGTFLRVSDKELSLQGKSGAQTI